MSICPSAGNGKSWKLPPNTGDGSYTNLFLTKAGLVTNTYSDADSTNKLTFVNTIQAEPYGFVLSGYYGSAPSRQGRDGNFWARSSDESGGNNSRFFNFYRADDAQYPGGFSFQRDLDKFFGRAVRCVLTSINKDV